VYSADRPTKDMVMAHARGRRTTVACLLTTVQIRKLTNIIHVYDVDGQLHVIRYVHVLVYTPLSTSISI